MKRNGAEHKVTHPGVCNQDHQNRHDLTACAHEPRLFSCFVKCTGESSRVSPYRQHWFVVTRSYPLHPNDKIENSRVDSGNPVTRQISGQFRPATETSFPGSFELIWAFWATLQSHHWESPILTNEKTKFVTTYLLLPDSPLSWNSLPWTPLQVQPRPVHPSFQWVT